MHEANIRADARERRNMTLVVGLPYGALILSGVEWSARWRALTATDSCDCRAACHENSPSQQQQQQQRRRRRRRRHQRRSVRRRAVTVESARLVREIDADDRRSRPTRIEVDSRPTDRPTLTDCSASLCRVSQSLQAQPRYVPESHGYILTYGLHQRVKFTTHVSATCLSDSPTHSLTDFSRCAARRFSSSSAADISSSEPADRQPHQISDAAGRLRQLNGGQPQTP